MDNILKLLENAGISNENIHRIGENEFRYRFWQLLPMEAYLTVSHLVDMEEYEDYDGDSHGRPVVFNRYSYKLRQAC
jgi:hypothetical protein